MTTRRYWRGSHRSEGSCGTSDSTCRPKEIDDGIHDARLKSKTKHLTLECAPGSILVFEMSECCCGGPVDTASRFACSACQTKGAPVDELTVKAVLTEAALQRFEPGAHRFCPDAACQVVYFDTANRMFTSSDCRVPVWQKEPPGRRLICYCFGENEADISAEIEQTGSSKAVERVRAHIAAGRCACEVRNPKGTCCLGDLALAVKRIAEHG